MDGKLYSIVDFQHVKPGKGGAFVRTKLKELKTGALIDKTFRAGERVEGAHLDERRLDYLYHADGLFHFMDVESFEQLTLSKDQLDGSERYLKENTVVTALMHKGLPVTISLPIFVELKVVKTEPGLRGDTAQSTTKSALLETGCVVQVPLFVREGDLIRIDTRGGQYLERI